MNVKRLREVIANLPDEMPVLIPAFDHSYRPASAAQPTTALHDRKERSWTEDYGERLTPEAAHGKRIDVLVIN